jgi:hypothetical protein
MASRPANRANAAVSILKKSSGVRHRAVRAMEVVLGGVPGRAGGVYNSNGHRSRVQIRR